MEAESNFKHREVWFVFGRTGFGKTHFTKKLLSGEISSELPLNRIIILDINEEYQGIIAKDFFELLEIVRQQPTFKISCRFTECFEHYEYVIRLAWELKNVCLVLEEAYNFIDLDSVKRLIRQGRHKNVSMIFVSPRVVDLTTDARAQAYSIISFRQNLPNDIARLETMGFEPESVQRLPIGNYLQVFP